MRVAWRAPLWAHTAALVVVLSVALVVVGDDGVFSSDEGAGLAQMETVADGQWGLAHPLPAVDLTGVWFPLEKAGALPDGTFAPLPKKPAYSWLGAQLWPLGGHRAVLALSAAGAALAALMAALVAQELDGGVDRAVLWVAGLASPLFADGLLVIGHTLAAAMGGAAALGSLRWYRAGGARWAILVVAAGGSSVLLRSESVLLVAAMGSTSVVLAGAHRRLRLLGPGLMVTGGAVCGLVADLSLTRSVFGSASVAVPAGSSTAAPGGGGGGYLDDRITAFVTTWLRPGYGVVEAAELAAILLVVLGVAAVLLARRGERAGVLTALWGAIGLVAVWRIAARGPIPDVVPGLLVAFPLLTWGLLGLRRATVTALAFAWCALSFLVFSLAVLATQYREGGAWEWGGRYFAVGLPLLVPLVVLGGRDAQRRLEPSTRLVSTAVVVTVVLSTGWLQLHAVRDSHALASHLVDRAVEAAGATPAGDGGPPVIVATEPELPRSAWDRLDRARWLYVPVSDLATAVHRLRATGVQAIVIATLDAPAAASEVPELASDRRGQVPAEGLWWFQPVQLV